MTAETPSKPRSSALAIALMAYGLSEKLWGIQPQRIDATEFIDRIAEAIEEDLQAVETAARANREPPA
jgi:L-fucose isomerase-like protein